MTLIIPRLRFVLIMVVTLATISVIFLVSYLFTRQYKKESLTHLLHYAETVAANVASAEADFIITETYASLQDSIVSFQQRVHVKSVTVIAPDGTILADTHPARLGTVFQIKKSAGVSSLQDYSHVDFDTWLVEVLAPIQVGIVTIGWCNIVLDMQYIQDGIAASEKKTRMVTVGAVLILSTIFFLFSSIITRPLDEIMNAASRVAEGDFDGKARVAGVFEIRRLAEVFNDMTMAVREREARLRQAQKMEAIGVLSGSIAHEFGNPLLGIDFLLKDLKKNGSLAQKELQLLDIGLDECARMKKLVRDLKSFYRPSSEEKTAVDLHQVIDNMLLFQKTHLQSKLIDVVRAYGKEIPQMIVVEDQLKQLVMNLLLNAAESIGERGGVVTISTVKYGETVRIAVKDTGTGISPQDQERIFMPFFSTKQEVSGIGLGLSVVYGIVKNHNGDIQVSSTLEQGATFTVTLPTGERVESS